MLQDFRSVSDHFGTLCIKGLSNTESELQKSIAYKKACICEKWAWKILMNHMELLVKACSMELY